MNTHNQNALFKLTYGLYVLTAREGDKDNGCIINVASQLTDTPQQMLVSVNKQNYTHDMIVRTGLFNVSLLTEHTPMTVIQHFGFQSGRDVNKFENCEVEMRSGNGLPALQGRCETGCAGQQLRHFQSVKAGTGIRINGTRRSALGLSDLYKKRKRTE
jgi:flavin reductase (DIM6/NTAB) family NADH-FMN oxidoreductase RutF